MILKIILIIILIYVIWKLMTIESFENTNIYPTRLLGMAKYIRLNKFNRIDAVYIKPPLPKTGESSCFVVQCPQWTPENSVCYRCI